MDALDRKILVALQEHGRKTNAELTQQLKVATTTMLERVRRLEENGLLRG